MTANIDYRFVLPAIVFIVIAVVAIGVLAAAPKAYGAGLNFSVNTTALLTGTGETLTIASGSTASSVAVGTSNVIVTVEQGDALTLSVSNKNIAVASTSGNALISNDPCYSNLDSLGKLIVTGGSGGGTATIQTAACTTKGSGGEVSQQTGLSVIPPVPTTSTTTAPTTTTVATLSTPIPVLPSSSTLTDVRVAVNKLTEQLNAVLSNLTSPSTPTLLEQLIQEVTQIQETLAAIPPRGSYNKTLSFGLRDNNVKALQQFLKSQGADIYPEGLVTGYFGSLTREAVKKFQEKYGIANEGDAGHGLVGPKTRAEINAILGL